MPINEVCISYDEDWTMNFAKLCRSNYNRSPFIEYILPDIEKIISQKPDSLLELNLELLRWIFDFIELNIELSFTRSYQIHADVEDMRHMILPQNRQDFIGKSYPQIFSDRFGFVTNLSILDLLFCTGKEARYYL